jgi:hypothetical protein
VDLRPTQIDEKRPSVQQPVSMEASPSPLSSRAQPRDLQFRGPILDMFFDGEIMALRSTRGDEKQVEGDGLQAVHNHLHRRGFSH